MIKRCGAAIADGAQGRSQIPLHQALAGFVGRPVVQKHRCDVGLCMKVGAADLEFIDVAARNDEPVVCQANRSGHQHRPRQGAVFLPSRFESQHRTGHADSEITVDALIAHGIAVRVEKHVRARSERRLLAKIDEGISAVRQMNHHEAAAAEIAAAWMRHCKCVTHGNRGIDGVSALAQNRCAGLGGEMLRRDHHAGARFQCRGRGSARTSGYGQSGQSGQSERCYFEANMHSEEPSWGKLTDGRWRARARVAQRGSRNHQ
jgi:hypothetical protein